MEPSAPPTIPPDCRPYKRTPTFDADTMPAGLRRAHTTKPGVWARIVVEEGALVYRVRDGAGGTFRLTPDVDGLVRPEEPHDVTPDGPVRFHVEFWAAEPPGGLPSTGLNRVGDEPGAR